MKRKMVSSAEVREGSQSITNQDCLDYIDKTIREQIFKQHNGIRVGQFFFNSLSPEDKELVRGSAWDCFAYDDWLTVRLTLAYIILAGS